jgi:hypothetical protein
MKVYFSVKSFKIINYDERKKIIDVKDFNALLLKISIHSALQKFFSLLLFLIFKLNRNQI